MTNKSPDTKLCEEAIRMEHRKSMRRHSALPMVVKVTRASRFLVTTPPKIASVGASQRRASCITIVSRAAVRSGPGGPFPRSEVTQRARRPLMSTVAGQRAITSVFQMRKHDSGASPRAREAVWKWGSLPHRSRPWGMKGSPSEGRAGSGALDLQEGPRFTHGGKRGAEDEWE